MTDNGRTPLPQVEDAPPRAYSLSQQRPAKKVAYGTIVAIGALAFTAASFAANYVFTTKVEFGDHKAAAGERITAVEGSMKLVDHEIQTNRRWLRRVHAEQKVMDSNIRKLLQDRKIEPIDADDLDAFPDLRVDGD